MEPQKKRKSSLGAFVRIAVSLLLVGLVYYTVDRKGVLRAVGSVSLRGGLVLVFLYILGQLLSAMKWRIFVEQVGIKRSPIQILRAYFLGMFVNVFGFGTVGGDVARGLAIMPAKGERAAALATVVADRVHGLTVLLGVGTIAMFLVYPPQLGTLTAILAYGGAAGLVCLGIAWWFGPTIFAKFFGNHPKWGTLAVRLSRAFPREPKPIVTATFISVIFHSVQLLMHLVIARELGANLSTAYILATVPFVNIVSSLPMSIMNGLGVREAMYCALFIPAGLPQTTAVAFGAMWLCTVTLVSSLGVLLLTPGTRQIVSEAGEGQSEEEQTSRDTEVLARQRATG
jgi:uncharacterized membrane protein YbhN (UPF0104 family)